MEEKEKDVNEEVKTEDNEFSPDAFSNVSLVDKVDEVKTEEAVVDDKTNDNAEEGEGEDFAWGDQIAEKNEEGEEEKVVPATEDKEKIPESKETEGTVEKKDEPVVATDKPVFEGALTDDHYSAFADELGIKAKSLPELKKAMQDLEAENDKLKTASTVTNDKIEKLQGFKKLDNEELVKQDLMAQGFKDEKLQDALDTFKDNGMLDIEATKINNAIDKAVKLEQDSLMQSSRDDDAKQQSDREQSVKALQSYLNETDEMFGFKMAKDEETLKAVRDNHHKYITSGTYLKEITETEGSLAESAWLWKNKDALIKAFKNGGVQRGRSEVLNDLGNPDADTNQRFSDPTGKGEFDAGRFNQKVKP